MTFSVQKDCRGRLQALHPKLVFPFLCFFFFILGDFWERYFLSVPPLPQLSQPVTTSIAQQPQGHKESFVPLHHPPFTSFSLMAIAECWAVFYVALICLCVCVVICLFHFFSRLMTMWLQIEKDPRDNLDFPFFNIIMRIKRRRCLWLKSIDIHGSNFGSSGVISVIQADSSLY